MILIFQNLFAHISGQGSNFEKDFFRSWGIRWAIQNRRDLSNRPSGYWKQFWKPKFYHLTSSRGQRSNFEKKFLGFLPDHFILPIAEEIVKIGWGVIEKNEVKVNKVTNKQTKSAGSFRSGCPENFFKGNSLRFTSWGKKLKHETKQCFAFGIWFGRSLKFSIQFIDG